MNPEYLQGKTILIIGGRPKEVIDGVRYYANHARPESHGHRVAAELAKSSARVILLSPEVYDKIAEGVAYRSISGNAAALLEAAQKLAQHEKMDAVLQLASVSSLKAAHVSKTKLKVKKEADSKVTMEAVGNVDLAAYLRAAWPEGTLLGYDNYQQFFEQGDSAFRDELRPVIETSLQFKQDFIPRASVKRTPSELAALGNITFHEDYDDLDRYVYAELEINGLYYVLMQYAGVKHATDILIPTGVSDSDAYIDRLLLEFKLTRSDLLSEATKKLTSPSGGKLSGRKIIVTSGPTMEQLTQSGDVITNFSSGAQGYAIAEALAAMGADVVLVSGPTNLPVPTHPRITTLHTESALAMRDTVLRHLPADAYIGVAAVADFGIHTPAPLMLKENESYTLMLTQNPDILHTVAHHAHRPTIVIGFAAETHGLLKYANNKLANKGADAICANPVDEASRKRLGSNQNQVTWLTTQGAEAWPVMSKMETGQRIGDNIAALLLKN